MTLGLRPRGLEAVLGASGTLLTDVVGLNLIVGRDEAEGPSASDGTGAVVGGGGGIALAAATETFSAAAAANCEALLAASSVLFIRDQSGDNCSAQNHPDSMKSRELTFLEKCLYCDSLGVRITTGDVVPLRVADHERKIALKSKSVFIHSFFKFRTHGAKIHRVFNHFKVTRRRHVNEDRNNRNKA